MTTQRERDRLYKRSVGLLVIFSVLAVLVMLRLYQQTAGPFRATLEFHAMLPRADGVVVDTPVTLAGLKIGRVTGVGLSADNQVRIDLAVEARVGDKIREDSRASVHRPIIGTAFIDIAIGSADRPPLADGQRIAADRVPDLNDLVATLPARLVAVDAILDDARALTGDLRREVGQLTADNGSIEQTFRQIHAVTARASEAAGRLNETLDEVRRVVAEAGKAIESANSTLVQAGALVNDLRPLGPQAVDMAASLDRSLKNVEALSAELRAIGPQIGPAVAAGQTALEEADDVLRAAKGSFLLRGNLPPPADPPGVPPPRP